MADPAGQPIRGLVFGGKWLGFKQTSHKTTFIIKLCTEYSTIFQKVQKILLALNKYLADSTISIQKNNRGCRKTRVGMLFNKYYVNFQMADRYSR